MPDAQKEELFNFRRSHPSKSTTLAGITWEYILSGKGPETLLILPGLLGFGEMSFQRILAFEREYQVIAPNYPVQVTRLTDLVEGIAGILDCENIQRTYVLGTSYGGMVAQHLVRHVPEKIGKLVLSDTGGPEAERVEKNQKFIRILNWMPIEVLRALLRLVVRKSLEDAPEQRLFWEAYSNEMIARLSKADLISRYKIAIDFDANSTFTSDDLKDWPGQILILEGDNDPIATAATRQALKNLYPQAEVHTFHGAGHVASIAKVDEHITLIKDFFRRA